MVERVEVERARPITRLAERVAPDASSDRIESAVLRRPLRKDHRTKRPYGVHLAITYGGLVAALIVAIVIVQRSPSDETVQRYGPNVVADLVGILLTLAVVERLLVWQQERAAWGLRNAVLRQVWRQLNSLTHMILFAYKATAPPGSPEPTSLDLLLDYWQRTAGLLDFRAPYGPDGPPRSWHQYAGEVVTRFEVGFRDVTDRYLPILGPDLPAAGEELLDTAVFSFLKHGPAIEQIDAQHGWNLPRLSFVVRSQEDPHYDSMAEFADRLRNLYAAYKQLGAVDLSLDVRLYQDHISPAWESARVKAPEKQPPSRESR